MKNDFTAQEVVGLLVSKLPEFLTQKGLARSIGVSQQYLNDILHGKREPGKRVLDFLRLKKTVLYRRF